MDDPAKILLTLIDTNRSLARLIILTEKRMRGEEVSEYAIDTEILIARNAYFRAKEMAIENGRFEGGFIPS